jgi:tetratricopeptide (TPR) repeat protein
MTSLVVAAAVVTALAPPSSQVAFAQKSPRERSALSRDAYDAGKKHYNLGEFDRAIELWKQGYEYKDDPIFLYNIAQAYRQKGDHQKAIFFYRAYIREEPRARNREDVEAKIAELTKLIEAQQNATDSPPVSPSEPPPEGDPPPLAVEAQTPPASAPPVEVAEDRDALGPRPGRSLEIGGAVAGGVGVAALATGIVFLVRASSIEGEIEDAARSGEPWSAELVDRESSGRTSQAIGWVAAGARVGLVATGVTLYVLGMHKNARARREAPISFAPLPVTSGAGVSAALSF